eukprot:scaffold232228_cov28-Tisochrysis_lutea.AAC.2
MAAMASFRPLFTAADAASASAAASMASASASKSATTMFIGATRSVSGPFKGTAASREVATLISPPAAASASYAARRSNPIATNDSAFLRWAARRDER